MLACRFTIIMVLLFVSNAFAKTVITMSYYADLPTAEVAIMVSSVPGVYSKILLPTAVAATPGLLDNFRTGVWDIEPGYPAGARLYIVVVSVDKTNPNPANMSASQAEWYVDSYTPGVHQKLKINPAYKGYAFNEAGKSPTPEHPRIIAD